MCIDKYVKMTHKVADQDDGLAGRRFDLRHAVDGRVDVIVAREPKTHKSNAKLILHMDRNTGKFNITKLSHITFYIQMHIYLIKYS